MVNAYNDLYYSSAAPYGIDPNLLLAQAEVESNGNPNAVGPDTKWGKAKGIAQLIPATAKSLGVTDPQDPNQAIPAQAKLMAENIQRYKDPTTALLAYHGGTDQRNWGKKTHAYAEKVNKKYQELTAGGKVASNQPVDPVEAALSADYDTDKISPQANLAAPATPSEDPIDAALLADYESDKPTAKSNSKKPPIGVPEDLLKTAASLPFKAIGGLTQIPALAGNAVANSLGYGVGKMIGASPEQQNRLNNINPFYTGNTSLDALTQAAKGMAYGDPGPTNPLTGDVLHSPETMPGRALDMVGQSALMGPTAGAKLIPSLAAGAGSAAASEAFPNNPLAPLIGGALAAGIPATASAIKFRPTPEELAGNLIQNSVGPQGRISPTTLKLGMQNQIVPGIKPTLAQVTNDPNIALIERQLQSKNPAAFRAQEDINESARQQHFEKASGTPQDVEAMEVARETQRAADTAAIFKTGQVADPAPVVTKIDDILSGPGGKRDAVISSLNNIRSKLVDENGNLESNPETLYRSVQKQIADLLDKKDLNNSAGRQASRELLEVKEVLDKTIDKASPGFQKYLDNYSNASSKIDAARWLQGLKLTDASGRYTLAKVKNALDNAKKLKNSPGINEAKNLTNDQVSILQNLHDSLHKRDTVANASMPRGSPTVQNALTSVDMNSKLGKTNQLLGGNVPEMLGSAAGAAAGTVIGWPGGGSFIGNMLGRQFKGAGNARNVKAENALQNFVLNPESYKQHLLNPGPTFIERLQDNLLKNP